jgi:phi LC3 family holin
MGVSADMFTSWRAVWEAIVGLVSNPFMLGSVAMAVLGIFVDPTTAGVCDSKRALAYDKPVKE